MAAVAPPASGGGLGLARNDNSRWGYAREDDNDTNSTFVFTQIIPSSRSSQSKETVANRELYTNDRTNAAAVQGHDTSILHATPIQPSSNNLSHTSTTDRLPSSLDTSRQRLEDLSRNGSEADSLLDLYRQQKGIMSNSMSVEGGAKSPQVSSSKEVDEGKWIHRDKLAAIESEEAREAGIQIPQEYLTNPEGVNYNEDPYTGITEDHGSDLHQTSERNGDAGARAMDYNEDSYTNIAKDQESDVHLGNETGSHAGRYFSPVTNEDDQEQAFAHDLRHPNELAAESYEVPSSPHIYPSQGTRSSSSRIPVATSSPLPIPQEYLERNTPLPRKRGTSANLDEDGLVYGKVRSRSDSIGSQMMLDDGAIVDSTPSSTSYPQLPSSSTKLYTPSKSQHVSSARKTSATPRSVSTAQKVRSASTTSRGSPAQRPATRSGLESRPATAINRPEGDAPWLADMYKPDPRLPQDQQIIPTHAKRLQQEHSKRLGSSSVGSHPAVKETRADASLPLNQQADHLEYEQDDGKQQFGTSRPEASKGPRFPSPGGEHAGYSTIPKLHTQAPIDSLERPAILQPIEVQEADETVEKEGRCGCCIVM
ncbi:hypothetical protein MMC13_007016 [Lambiella insularis]|nr:hypothetical protein [Lambiella insularis]